MGIGDILYKLLLTINATSWMVIIYTIKEGWAPRPLPLLVFGIFLLLIPVVFSLLSIYFAKFLDDDALLKCQEYSLADNEFLPTYLGYFFLSVSITETSTMIVVYLIVFVFTYLSQTQYFNPLYLLFGYHYYHILTPLGTRVFVIARGKVIRNKENISFEHLKRMNDTTYIERS